MSKFILTGGFVHKASDGGQAFAEEIVQGFDQPTHILDCAFARPRDSWAKTIEDDKHFFATKLRDQKVLLELADPSRFAEQLEKTDAVYFRGGKTEMLLETLKSCVGWESALKDKTIAGSSAGVNRR